MMLTFSAGRQRQRESEGKRWLDAITRLNGHEFEFIDTLYTYILYGFVPLQFVDQQMIY